MKLSSAKQRAQDGPTKEKSAQWTTPQEHYVVLYVGLCKFCVAGARKLMGLACPGAVALVSFQEPGVLDRFPGVTREACMRQMHLITPEGRVVGGFEAAVQAVATRPLLGFLAYAYYLPGIRYFCDIVYRFIASRRYRILGKNREARECKGGTCSVHFQAGQNGD